MQKTKKDLSFFGFSQVFNHQFIQKTKKTLSFFSFFKVMTKKNQKNSRKTKKNQTWASDQTFSEKFWFFGLVFSRFFGFWFSRGLASRGRRICEAVTSGPYLILVLQLCFSFFVAIYPKKHIPLPAFGIHYFPMQTPFPKICPAIYFTLLSLKTGLFQREVALFLWQPDFFKGK